jgi:pimeloyl-ACP methyl ester carboxylesterase
MNTTDLLSQWSTLSLDEIEAQLESPSVAQAARKLYGAKPVRQMRAARTEAAFSPRGTEPVVLLPGIMGSLLSSIRGVTSLLWINPTIFLQGKGNYLDLNAAGDGDANPAVEVTPVSIERLFYLKISLILRREAQLYEFPFDWRRTIETSADVLHASLERWADGDSQRRFTLLGHSMGGIVSRAYLTRHPREAERRIKRVITLGTPYFGAAGAIENMIHGNDMMALAQTLNSGNVPQRMLLSFPSVYQLLPAPPDLFPAGRPYPANWDLYRASEWRWPAIRQDYLDLTRASHAALHHNAPDVEIVQIAGCNASTTTDMVRTFDANERPIFEAVKHDKGADGGDATVPLWSAVLPGARMYYINEKHRYLPSNDKVISGVLDLLSDGQPRLATSVPPAASGIFRAERDFISPEAEADALRQKLEAGTANAEDLERLYFAL